jgi:hypothetical protein
LSSSEPTALSLRKENRVTSALSGPTAVVASVVIASICLILAIGVWQTFAIVIRADRQAEREQRLPRTNT